MRSIGPDRRPFSFGFAVIAAAALLLSVLASGRVARADVVTLKDGKKLEGRVSKEDATSITIDTKFGSFAIERAKIERIEKQKLPQEELDAMVKSAGNDAEKLWDAACYARDKRIKDKYLEIAKRVIVADPMHRAANEALGRIQYDGRWFSPEELEKYKSDMVAAMKADGKVLYQGRWVKEEDAKRWEGYELYEGQWLKWKEIYKLQAEKKIPEMLGVPLKVTQSDHFTLCSNLEPDLEKETLDTLEAGFTHFMAAMQPNETEKNIIGFFPIAVYVMPEVSLVEKFVRPGGLMDTLYITPKNINARYADANCFPVFFPRPLIVSSEGRHVKGGGSKNVGQVGFLTMYEGNLLIRRFKRGARLPGWVEDGMAHYYEGTLNGYRTLSICEFEPDPGEERVTKWEQGIETFEEWYKKIADPNFRALLPRLGDLKAKFIEDLTARDIMKSYFLVRFMLEKHPQQFPEYVRLAYEQKGSPAVETPEDTAFQQAFGTNAESIDAEFNEWAAAQGPKVPVE